MTDKPQTEWVLVPAAAIAWLMGEGPDQAGFHFGDFPDDHPPVGKFWWRSDFRSMLAASPAPPVPVAQAVAVKPLEWLPVEIPTGWYLVPEVPTEEQMAAGLYQSSHDAKYADVCQSYMDMVRTPLDAPELYAAPVPPGQPDSAARIAELEAEVARLRERLDVGPDGDDAIDVAESAVGFLRHRIEGLEGASKLVVAYDDLLHKFEGPADYTLFAGDAPVIDMAYDEMAAAARTILGCPYSSASKEPGDAS